MAPGPLGCGHTGQSIQLQQGVDGHGAHAVRAAGRPDRQGRQAHAAGGEDGDRIAPGLTVAVAVDETAQAVLQSRWRQAVDLELYSLGQGEGLPGDDDRRIGRGVV